MYRPPLIFDVTGWSQLNMSITGFFNDKANAYGRLHPYTFNLLERVAYLEMGDLQVVPARSNPK